MPKINVQRSIKINAEASKIHKIINDFHQWGFWSPWLIMEPDATVKVAKDAKSYEWKGKRVGAGNMKILEEKDHEFVDYELNFLKPWKSKARTHFSLNAEGKEVTTITWTMDSSIPLFMFWMKKMMEVYVGADYERGLEMLKAYVENGEVYTKLDFKGFSGFKGCNWVGIKTLCSIDDMPAKMQEDFEKINEYRAEESHNIAGDALSIYHQMNLLKNQVSYTAAVQVKKTPSNLPEGFVTGSIPVTKIYTLRHTGRYQHLGNAWSTLHTMHRMKEFKIKKGIHPFEMYLNDPKETSEKDLITEIHFPVK